MEKKLNYSLVNSSNVTIFAFVFFSVLYLTAILFSFHDLLFITKPLIIPIIFLYYILKIKKKIQIYIVISLVLFFISEFLAILNPKKFYFLIVLFFLIPYLFLLLKLINEFCHLHRENNKKIQNLMFLLLFIFVFLFSTCVSILLIIDIHSISEIILLYSYALTIPLLAVISVVLFVFKSIRSNLYLIFTVLSFMVYALFFMIVEKVEFNAVLMLIGKTSQLLGFYFFVTYSILKIKEEVIL